MRLLLTFLVWLSALAAPAFDYPRLRPLQTYYVSSSEGNDANPGTISRPLRSLSALSAPQRRDANILLRRGDVFFESLHDFEGCNIDAYGHGESPVVCGFLILEDSTAWQSVEDSIWRLDLLNERYFSGFMPTQSTNRQTYTAVGMIYHPASATIFGRLQQHRDSLLRDGDYWQTSEYLPARLRPDSFRYLCFRSSTPPASLGRLCLSVAEHGVWGLVNCRLANISVVGFARHGMTRLYDTLVEDCKVDMIGGSVLLGFKHWSRYGNGIELNVSGTSPSRNVMVRRCQVTRTFDSGLTIQGTNRVYSNAVGMHFVNNRVAYCRQGFEWYLVAPDDFDPSYSDCSLEDNLFFENGNNGFGLMPQGNECQLLSYEHRDKALTITGNTFYGASYYCGYRFGPGRTDNTVYIWRGSYLNGWIGYKAYRAIYADTAEDAAAYKARSGEQCQIHILDKDSAEDRSVRQRLLKTLALHFPSLNI